MEQVAVLQELNIQLENQNQGLKAQMEVIRAENENKLICKTSEVKKL